MPPPDERKKEDTMDEEYVRSLENVIKQMLRPLRNTPLQLVIEAISGHKIIPFNPNDPQDRAILQALSKACTLAGEKVNVQGILRPRPNEVGNDIEKYVKDALTTVGYKAFYPLTKSGGTRTMGYPDIQFVDEVGRHISYLECKTFNIANVGTSQRSFYLSPSEDFKVTVDAHHFLAAFEIYVEGKQGPNNIYKCTSWKIASLERLPFDVKYEFNSDNARLYHNQIVLAEGKL